MATATVPTPPELLEFPTPRDGLDSGSVGELADDCRAIDLPEFAPLAPRQQHVDIDVPEGAASMVTDLDDYGF
ncbi:hypothetical protein [Intrasporangium sp. DVR]|uniref:hypothetical protein n=1 Tax=Intrasporangium sp. DVR TaxID=3127867 RepID=UPI00313A7448